MLLFFADHCSLFGIDLSSVEYQNQSSLSKLYKMLTYYALYFQLEPVSIRPQSLLYTKVFENKITLLEGLYLR